MRLVPRVRQARQVQQEPLVLLAPLARRAIRASPAPLAQRVPLELPARPALLVLRERASLVLPDPQARLDPLAQRVLPAAELRRKSTPIRRLGLSILGLSPAEQRWCKSSLTEQAAGVVAGLEIRVQSTVLVVVAVVVVLAQRLFMRLAKFPPRSTSS